MIAKLGGREYSDKVIDFANAWDEEYFEGSIMFGQMDNRNTIEEKIVIRKLTKEGIIDIYSTYSVRHFPADERKPVSSVERMADEGIYIGYGLYLSETGDVVCGGGSSLQQPHGPLLGYALFTVLPEQKICLLDYFAVMEDYRSHGVGSLFLQHMRESSVPYGGFLIESEDPDYAQGGEELAIRRKRLDFYGKNGAISTGIKANVFGVPYCLLFFPLKDAGLPDTQTLCQYFSNIYRRMVSPYHYETNIHIYPPSGPEFCD